MEPDSQIASADSCYRHPGVIGPVGCQRCGNRICPQCMSSASVGFHCPDCVAGASQQVYTAQTLPGPSEMLTKVLIGINALIFVAGMSSTQLDTTLRVDFGLIGRAISGGQLVGVAEGEVWRMVTSGFLHGGLMHVGFNMYLLWQLGRGMEGRLGVPRFAALYFASMLGGSFAVMLLDPGALTIGASGAVFGLMGALMVMQLQAGMNPMQGGIGGLVAINLVLTFLIPNISIGGHIGGLAAGALVAWIYGQLDDRKMSPMIGVGIVIALALVFFVGGVALAGR